MRNALLVLVVVESLALVGMGGVLLHGDEALRSDPPRAPVFRPPIYDAVIGDKVRYQRQPILPDGSLGEIDGYLEYDVKRAEEVRGTTLGRTFLIEIVESGRAATDQRRRVMVVRPRDSTHGFLPPRFDEDDRPQGARPVIKTIASAPVTVYRRERPGFRIDAVTPRLSLTEVTERYWITDEVPVFGVARWDRDGNAYVLHSASRGGAR